MTEQPYQIVFSGFFRFAPKMFASIASYHGRDSAELRAQSVASNGATVLIEEETCAGEQGGYTHGNAEQVDYFALLAGVGSSADQPNGGIRARPASTTDPRNAVTQNREAAGNLRPFAEMGQITADSDWITVELDSYYFHPAIIAGTPTFAGNQPASARIRNLRHGHGCAGWCFDLRLQEAPCMDDVHVEEQVS